METKVREVLTTMMLIVATSSSFAYEVTDTQKIARVQYDGSGLHLYFVGDLKWSAPGCPNATYVWIKPDLPGIKAILSIALSAFMGGREVEFRGVCAADTDYFSASYIVVK